MRGWGAVLGLALACGGSGKQAPAVAPTPEAPGDAGGTGGGAPPGTDPGATSQPGPPASAPGAPGATCVAATCVTAGKSCGQVDDGCGGKLFCGTCAAGQVCGAGGAPNVCAAPVASCVPTTCAALQKSCGKVPDGCGGALECGACAGTASCGGGGTANVCGSPPVPGGGTTAVSWLAGAEGERPFRLRADAAGNLYLVTTVSVTGGQRLDLRKLGPDLALAWGKSYSVSPAGAAVWMTPYGFDVSPAGDLYLSLYVGCASVTTCGVYSGCAGGSTCSVDFGGGPASGPVLVKLGPDGGFRWQKTGLPLANGIAAGDGRVAVQHWAEGRAFEVFDGEGTSLWTSAVQAGQPLAFAADGSLYASAYDVAASSPVLQRYDAAGIRLWSRPTGWIQSLTLSGRGTPVALEWSELAVYEAADGAERFRRSLPLFGADLAVQPGTSDVIRAVVVGQDSAGCNQMAVRAYDLAGAFRWSRLVGVKDSCGGSPQATTVAVEPDGRVIVAGQATVPTDLGPGEHTPNGAADGFVLELAP